MGCAACVPASEPGTRVLHAGVPVVTQFASADLVEAIVYRGHDPVEDPAWPESGAADLDEYRRWCGQACGMACLHMVLRHRDGNAPPILRLLLASLPYGTYTTGPDGDIRGLFYAPFAAYARAVHQLPAAVHPHLTVAGIAERLAEGRLVIASVHREIRRPDRPAPGRGGHLVLVTGHDPAAGTITFHNPSGHIPAARQATLHAEVFDGFFAGRGISIDAAPG